MMEENRNESRRAGRTPQLGEALRAAGLNHVRDMICPIMDACMKQGMQDCHISIRMTSHRMTCRSLRAVRCDGVSAPFFKSHATRARAHLWNAKCQHMSSVVRAARLREGVTCCAQDVSQNWPVQRDFGCAFALRCARAWATTWPAMLRCVAIKRTACENTRPVIL